MSREQLLEAKSWWRPEQLRAIVRWLEANQEDVFRRGLWDAINAAERSVEAAPVAETPADYTREQLLIASRFIEEWAETDKGPREAVVSALAKLLRAEASRASGAPSDALGIKLDAFQEFRRELVLGTLPHEEKDLTMQIKRVLTWADQRIGRLQREIREREASASPAGSGSQK